MPGQVEGKVALVTGGASGIGRATALTFAREGAKLIIADMNEAGGHQTVRMITENGGAATRQPISRVSRSRGDHCLPHAARSMHTWVRMWRSRLHGGHRRERSDAPDNALDAA